ncbi:hypothetical protein GCM10011507_32040 [Edaphobacter acidisoli]|uniref:Uncharacterized protein n=1 Tax=Edaphobacter acidisoli TaxID=2040573 RepID=A0A916W9E3_9BACT|nr:hypothetical protein [Edaphobacter acidisoli]GGA78412.1 hypothetical protein GCM10011507_32040 [Edaphobacter acidisoli]
MRDAILEDPTLLFLILFAFALPLLIRLQAWDQLWFRRLTLLGGAVSVLVFLQVNIANVSHTRSFWHDERHIIAIAAAYMHGEPMYPSPAAADLYALVYGPVTYLIFVPFLALFHHPLPAIRVGILAVNLATLLVLFLILRKRIAWQTALGLLSVATATLLAVGPALLGMRGDSWMLFSVCVALLSALSRNWVEAAAFSGVFGAIAIGFKPTVAPVVLLLLVILYRKHGRRALVSSALITAMGVFSVYLLRGISLQTYLIWLVRSDHRPFVAESLISSLLASALLALPAVLLLVFSAGTSRRRRVHAPLAVFGIIALVGCIVTGSKHGAGAWHIWPMIPFLLLWAAYDASEQEAEAHPLQAAAPASRGKTGTVPDCPGIVITAIVLAATVVTARYGFRDFRNVHRKDQAEQRAEEIAAGDAIDRITAHPLLGRNIEMGYGESADDYRSDLRFMLPLRGQDDFFDANAVFEAAREGLAVPSNVVERILGCQDIWLVPHGEVPFSTLLPAALPASTSPFLFPDSIRLGFSQSHVLLKSGPIYDQWGCPTV